MTFPGLLMLPAGITGFGSSIQAPHSPALSFAAFHGVCSMLARSLFGRVIRTQNSDGHDAPNFHIAEIQARSGSYCVLLNAFYPWVAVMEEWPVWMGGRFLDSPEIQAVLVGMPEFRYLHPEELETPVTPTAIAELTAHELGQLRRWTPARLGDVIFNFWD